MRFTPQWSDGGRSSNWRTTINDKTRWDCDFERFGF